MDPQKDLAACSVAAPLFLHSFGALIGTESRFVTLSMLLSLVTILHALDSFCFSSPCSAPVCSGQLSAHEYRCSILAQPVGACSAKSAAMMENLSRGTHHAKVRQHSGCACAVLLCAHLSHKEHMSLTLSETCAMSFDDLLV